MAICAIESHAGVSFLDKDLANGVLHGAICRKYGVTEMALQNHIDVCLANPTPQSVLNNLADAARSAQRLLDEAMSARDKDAAFKALDRVTKLQETIGRSMGMFKSDQPSVDARSVTVNVLKDLSREELRAIVALRPAD